MGRQGDKGTRKSLEFRIITPLTLITPNFKTVSSYDRKCQ